MDDSNQPFIQKDKNVELERNLIQQPLQSRPGPQVYPQFGQMGPAMMGNPNVIQGINPYQNQQMGQPHPFMAQPMPPQAYPIQQGNPNFQSRGFQPQGDGEDEQHKKGGFGLKPLKLKSFQEIPPHEDDCYSGCLSCMGGCFGFLRTWLPCICCCCDYPFLTIPQSMEGLRERFGKFTEKLKPGLHYRNIWTDEIKIIDMKIQNIKLDSQILVTKDNISISLDAYILYRVGDSFIKAYRLSDLDDQLSSLTYQALRNAVGECTLQEFLSKRGELAQSIGEAMKEHLIAWNIIVEALFILDIKLTNETRRDLSLAAQQKKISEAKIISAQANVVASKLMKEAADLLNSNAAMQIRYLETLETMGNAPNGKYMFLPLQPNSDGSIL